MKMFNSEKWSLSRADTFWKGVAPGEHVLQVYEDTDQLINILASFVGSGINEGDSVVIIADPNHTSLLENKLREHALKLDTLVSDNRLILLDAEETLNSFLTAGKPDKKTFRKVITGVIDRARGKENRRVRAFGEMVAYLWNRGQHSATGQLENYWDELCKEENILLFCAYPKKVFENVDHAGLDHICQAHSKIVRNSDKPLIEIQYHEIQKTA